MPAFQNLTGQKYNLLTAVQPTEKRECGSVVWVWSCECGQQVDARAAQVKNGHIKSCGCLFHQEHRSRIEPQICRHCGDISTRRTQTTGRYTKVCSKCANRQSNGSRDPIKGMLGAAKVRAKKAGVPFNLKPKDIVIPEFCPVLGIKMERGTIADRANSPSLDKIVPELGYVVGNIAVISFRANLLKNRGSADEHRRIADWMVVPTSSRSYGVTDYLP